MLVEWVLGSGGLNGSVRSACNQRTLKDDGGALVLWAVDGCVHTHPHSPSGEGCTHRNERSNQHFDRLVHHYAPPCTALLYCSLAPTRNTHLNLNIVNDVLFQTHTHTHINENRSVNQPCSRWDSQRFLQRPHTHRHTHTHT